MAARKKEDLQNHSAKPVLPHWELAAQWMAEIPAEEWGKLPHDGSINHDHYIYGLPKVEE